MRRMIPFLAVLCLVALLAGCASWSRTGKGAAIGGVAGAVVGTAVSKDNTKGAVLGGAAGAVVGGLIGNYLDKQAKELEAVKGAEVQRQGDELKITFSEKILFDVDSSTLKPASQSQLDQVADVLNKYPDTDILVMGHTDATGTEEYNQRLSERRATAVANYIEGRGVADARVAAKGFGETSPVADNATEEGRAMNRRVEFSIHVNEAFKADAARQAG
ncbi:MAG: OmpA family protein [Candidatus Krumholzibacteriia bacterium]